MNKSSKIEQEEYTNRKKLKEEEKEKLINELPTAHTVILIFLMLLIFWVCGLLKY